MSPVNGHPLFSYSVSTALMSPRVRDCYVVTRDAEEAAVAREYGAKSLLLEATASWELTPVISEIEQLENKTYALVAELPWQAPLREADDLAAALNALEKSGAASLRAVAPGAAEGQSSADLKSINVYRRSALADASAEGDHPQSPSEYPETELTWEIDPRKALRVDTLRDLVVAEHLVKRGWGTFPEKLYPRAKVSYGPAEPGRPVLLWSAAHEFLVNAKQTIAQSYNAIYAFGAQKPEVKQLLAEATIWVTPTRPPYLIDEEMLAHAPHLKVVATPSTGTNHIMLDDLERRGIHLISIKKSKVIENIHASSEFSFALLLGLIKNLPQAVDRARAGQWVDRPGHWIDYEAELRNIEVFGMTMGLMGFGRIGHKMARFGHGMGMKVIATDPHRRVDVDYVEEVELPDLLAQSDFFCIHIHLDETTQGLVDGKLFSQLKRGAYLLNTSRGEVLNEPDLLEYLENGHIKAAALDVISDEHVADKRRHPLIEYSRQHPTRLIISPHIGGCSVHSEGKSAADILIQIEQFLNTPGV